MIFERITNTIPSYSQAAIIPETSAVFTLIRTS